MAEKQLTLTPRSPPALIRSFYDLRDQRSSVSHWLLVRMVYFLCNAIALVAALYVLFDVNYFVRAIFTLVWRKFMPRKRKRISEKVNSYGFCTTNDVDTFVTHMNNGRFLRELDFARFDFYERTGLFGVIMSQNGQILQGASTIRYRKPLPIFSFYKITTRLVYWDDKALYLEHMFVTVSDNFIRATAISKQNIVGMNLTISALLRIIDPDLQKPEPEEDLKHWLIYIDASSRKLKKETDSPEFEKEICF